MSHDDRSREEDSAPFMASAYSWIPLDELVALWTAFGQEATTASATRATSAAFAALAEEREALHVYNAIIEEQHRSAKGVQGVDRYQDSIEALSLAADQWYTTAYALEEYAAQCIQGKESVQQDLCTLIGHTLAQRLRVWNIAQQLLMEQVACYPPYQGVEAKAVTPCQQEGDTNR